MNGKKILIIAYKFYPDNTPRAFRAFELMKEFSKKYEVTILTKKSFMDLRGLEIKYNIKILQIPSGFFLNKDRRFDLNSSIEIKKSRKGKKILSKIFNYLFYNREIEFAYNLKKELDKIKDDYDIIISICNPFSSHIGTYLSLKNVKNKKKVIFDYGDPFFLNPTFKGAFYFKYLEKLVLTVADNIVIPIVEAKKAFSIYPDSLKKIKVIPQGINLEEIEIETYKENRKPVFMYAGAFYENIRNPLLFLKEITEIKDDYRFEIYTDLKNLLSTKMGLEILKYSRKNKRIILKDKITREECIKKMSKMDFLINIENMGGIQSPSKIIDYGLSKRPVFSFNQKNFNKVKFLKFLNRDYTNSLEIDLKKYDIENIVKLFEELF